ncbi:hypothetical protein ACJMK2_043193 [Sinanodonta woodiana]|uniref:Uncharacterized protein n=1 Tax=Sinanodonta woodiana TaxID=1069815 RepID=A0ABD3VW57_SINWO
MGVISLWSILDEKDVGQRTNLRDLSGKRLAVDLSIWILELKRANNKLHDSANFFLKNLFYRILGFLKNGIQIVFAIDALHVPSLKMATFHKRRKESCGAEGGRCNDRSKFQIYVNKCVGLFDKFGIPYLTSSGEAEALCAKLNKNGLVDACLTGDGDVFCYGAKHVYRNLQKLKKEYYVDIYTTDSIQEKVCLDQRSFVVLALLCGCDYNKSGVKSIGHKKALSLLRNFQEKKIDPLDRMLGWRSNTELKNLQEIRTNTAKKDPHCYRCHHVGDLTAHDTTGCSSCTTNVGCTVNADADTCYCEWHQSERKLADFKEDLTKFKEELDVREKALMDCNFPNKEIIHEFLVDKNEEISLDKVCSSEPDVIGIVCYMLDKVRMDGVDIMRHLITALVHIWLISSPQNWHNLKLEPISILRESKENFRLCYEVKWKKLEVDTWTEEDYYTTHIERDLFKQHYSEMVKEFVSSQGQGKQVGFRKRKSDDNITNQTTIDSIFPKKKK